jgi:hypothetical protein
MSRRSIVVALVAGILSLSLPHAGRAAASPLTSFEYAGLSSLDVGFDSRFGGGADIFAGIGTGLHASLLLIEGATASEVRIAGSTLAYSVTARIDRPRVAVFVLEDRNVHGTIVSATLDVHVTASAFAQPGGPGTRITVDAGDITPESSVVLRGHFVSGTTVYAFDTVVTNLSGALRGGRITVDPASGDPVTSVVRQRIFLELAESSGEATAVPAPREVRLTGKAHGVGRGFPAGGLSMVGSFVLDRPVDLGSVRSVSILQLLSDGNSDVFGGNLPTIPGDPRNRARSASFTLRPPFGSTRVLLGARSGGKFTFRIEMSDAFIPVPAQCPEAMLDTAFVFNDGVSAPVVVSVQQPWRCFGTGNQYLKTP